MDSLLRDGEDMWGEFWDRIGEKQVDNEVQTGLFRRLYQYGLGVLAN